MTGIRRRISIAFLSIVGLLFASGMISFFELSHLSYDTEEILKANQRNVELAKEMLGAVHDQNVAIVHLVQPSVATRRVEELEELCRRLHGEFCARAEGTTDEVLFESTMRGGMMFGYTGNYRRVKAPYDRSRINTICRVRLGRMDDANDLEGEIVDN